DFFLSEALFLSDFYFTRRFWFRDKRKINYLHFADFKLYFLIEMPKSVFIIEKLSRQNTDSEQFFKRAKFCVAFFGFN
ncbi:MAG TPA: hypothetical protein PLQ81_03655, partial [bacterium]|nr:hypothetical protein [bacterium]